MILKNINNRVFRIFLITISALFLCVVPSFAEESIYLSEEKSMMEKHRIKEKELLEWYADTDENTLETAVVHQDLYENAPLTAVVLFETDEPEIVSVTVHGKTPDCDIAYDTESSKHHEILIFGLYPGYENRVTLTTGSGDSREFKIMTEALPEQMTQITKTLDQGEQSGDRLFYICDKWRTIYDKNGDVRWYMSGIPVAFSGIDEVDPVNHCFWFSTEGSSASMASVYCVDFSGRLMGKYFALGKSAHHDATILPDGKLLYLSKWKTQSSELSILDPATGTLERYTDPQELFDNSLGSLEYKTRKDKWDFLHANAVEYIPDNNSLLLSFRNQHMIMAMDYDTKEVKWVLTPAYEKADSEVKAIQDAFSDVLVLPEDGTDFEWFYSQHSPRLISYDAQNDIYDIVVFDNGTNRFLASESGNADVCTDQYSRLVRYEIDAKNKVVRQVYEFGDDHPEFYSDQCGSAQYLPEEDRYIANYPGLETEDDKRFSIVSESDGDGKEIAEYLLANIPDGSYRVMTYDIATFVPKSDFISNRLEYTETYHHDGKHWEASDREESSGDETYAVSEINLTEKGLTIRGHVNDVNKKGKIKFRLLAIDSQGHQYEMPLVCFRGNRFYMPGVDMAALPKGTYQIAIYMEINGEPIGYKMLPYQYSEDMKYSESAELENGGSESESGNAGSDDTGNAKRDVIWELLENSTNWEVKISEIQKTEEVRSVVPVIQYDGSIDNIEYINRPTEGCVFLLMNLQVAKKGSGSGAFSWKNVTLTDASGNVYCRMDDVFLEDQDYDRMSGTDIKLGSKEGWICFEIPEENINDAMLFEFLNKDGERLAFKIDET